MTMTDMTVIVTTFMVVSYEGMDHGTFKSV